MWKTLKLLRIDFFIPVLPFAGKIESWKHNLKHLLQSILLIIFRLCNFMQIRILHQTNI